MFSPPNFFCSVSPILLTLIILEYFHSSSKFPIMHIQPRKSRIAYILILTLTFLIIYLESRNRPDFESKVKEIKLKGGIFLKNIQNDDAEMLNNLNRHVFFIDGDGETEAVIRNAKKACNIEAAGKTDLLLLRLNEFCFFNRLYVVFLKMNLSLYDSMKFYQGDYAANDHDRGIAPYQRI